MKLKHELWTDSGDDVADYTFCLAGPRGNDARALLSPRAKLLWTVEAGSFFEAMSAYYEFMGWGEYRTEHESDRQPYPDE